MWTFEFINETWSEQFPRQKKERKKKFFAQTHRVRISWVEDDFVILRFSRALQSHNFLRFFIARGGNLCLLWNCFFTLRINVKCTWWVRKAENYSFGIFNKIFVDIWLYLNNSWSILIGFYQTQIYLKIFLFKPIQI